MKFRLSGLVVKNRDKPAETRVVAKLIGEDGMTVINISTWNNDVIRLLNDSKIADIEIPVEKD